MRRRRDPQATMLAFVDLEERVPQDHPIRTIKIIADDALERLSPEFDQMYSKVGLRGLCCECSGTQYRCRMCITSSDESLGQPSWPVIPAQPS